MSLRSFRKRPPFLIPNRAPPFNLPCAPCIKARGTWPTHYPEFEMFPGPNAIAEAGDNSLLDLIARTWALLLCDDFRLLVLRWSIDPLAPPEGLLAGEWEEITELLPPFPEFTGFERRFTGAFDQSARLLYAYEIDGEIKATRWDATINQYVQNVAIAGRDPCLAYDATWAYDVPESDVLLFYLSLDRERLYARVQRESFTIERLIHDYGRPVVLDRVQRIPLRYMVLASEENGAPIVGGPSRLALISDPYPYLASDTVQGTVALTDDLAVHTETLVKVERDDHAFGTVAFAPTPAVHANAIFFHARTEGERLLGAAAFGPDAAVHTSIIGFYASEEPERIVGTVALLDTPAQHTRLLVYQDRIEPERVLGHVMFAPPNAVHRRIA